ncbi:MAG: extracellular solute-binding protein [Alphaproteobacteria bacterium]|nr:extracellular solute-binding protein [Alphaproteobacteria bacterium]
MRAFRTLVLAAAVSLPMALPASAQDLVIWWTKGVTQAEDDAFKAVVAAWEKQTGKKVDVSFYASGDTEAKTIPALKAGLPPDLTYDFSYDLAYTPTWAYDDLMADVSDVIEPIKGQIQSGVLDSLQFLNGKTGKKSYYAMPFFQMSPHVHYWKDLLEQAGFKESDVPNSWEPFFDF